jgi:hypothetical protein
MTFTPTGAVAADDPALRFSNGSRTVTFTIPANTTTAIFPTPVSLLTGTVSGTVTLTTNLQGGPQGAPAGSITISPTIPQMTTIVATRTPEGLKVEVTGYSPERKVLTADFAFDVTTPSGTQRVNLTRNVESDFDQWYTGTSSTAFGSSFVFDQLFVVQGEASTIKAVTVTLSNGQGSASSGPMQIP